jgi:hypothetical protein
MIFTEHIKSKKKEKKYEWNNKMGDETKIVQRRIHVGLFTYS